MRHIVMYTGGAGSWATAGLVADRLGTENLTVLFAGYSPMEDEDRFGWVDGAETKRPIGGPEDCRGGGGVGSGPRRADSGIHDWHQSAAHESEASAVATGCARKRQRGARTSGSWA